MSTKLLRIDRTRWLRGEPQRSYLRSARGNMCCLGFYALACGIPPEDILGLGEPHEVANPERFPEWMMRRSEDGEDEDGPYDAWLCPMEQTDAVGDLIGANDDASLSEPEREAMIRRLFADHGVEVEFVDDDWSALP